MKCSQLNWATILGPNNLFKERGFSLVQVMVSVGIMGGLAMAMMKMMENQTKQQKTIELKAEQGDIAAIIRQVLANKVACETTFIGMSPGDTIKEIRMNSDLSVPPFAETGVKFKNNNVYIKSMYLLTRPEEVTAKQRPANLPPIEYNDPQGKGFGYGYLKITFVKNIGAVTDLNKSHQFYGAKETALILPIAGNFYDLEIVKHNDWNKLNEACYLKAASKSVNCSVASHERCWYEQIDLNGDGVGDTNDSIIDQASQQPLYLAECHYFRDDSPFIACVGQ